MKRLFLVVLLWINIGCSEGQQRKIDLEVEEVWKYSDLRAIDPSDTIDPNQDMIGFFFREQHSTIQMRVDFLALEPEICPYITVAFSNNLKQNDLSSDLVVDPNDWDYLLTIQSDGQATLHNAIQERIQDAKITIVRDLGLGAIIIKVNKMAFDHLSIKTSIKVFSINGINDQVDQLGPILAYGNPPPPINLILGFWNSFQGDTPSQALKSWDGAHTGPYSTRHGLHALLAAVEQTKIPIYLMDISRPEKGKAALDYMGVLPWLQRLQDQGLVIVANLDDPRQLPDSIIFSEENINKSDEQIPDGLLTPDLIRNLLSGMEKNDQILLFGGDFSKSLWGNQKVALQTLSFIKNHPWLRVVNDPSIFRNRDQILGSIQSKLIAQIGSELLKFPENQIRLTAEELLAFLTQPTSPQEDDLRSIYTSQLGHLLALLRWSENPREMINCSNDLDWDEEPECILATSTTAAIIEGTVGGYVSFSFTYHAGEFHQIIGPSYQLVTSLSDPMTWDISSGIRADPSLIPGAFSNISSKWMQYSVTVIEPGTIRLLNKNSGDKKIFSIHQNTIDFQYQTSNPDNIIVPLLIDPWIMDVHGWGTRFESSLDPSQLQWTWGLVNQVKVVIQASSVMEVTTFRDSYELMQEPEMPSYSYPGGHFLPFPLAVAKIDADKKVDIRLEITVD